MDGNVDLGGPNITIECYGPLRVTDFVGSSRLPKGRKAAAILALLSTDPHLERSRAFLQEILWSDRGREQRAASLRQSLAELKRVFADIPEALIATRGSVRLNPERVCVVQDCPDGATDASRFLEGLTVRDKAFDNWLLAERAMRAQTARATSGRPMVARRQRSVIVVCDGTSATGGHHLAEALRHDILKSLAETCAVHAGTADILTTESDSVVISVQSFDSPGGCVTLRVLVQDLAREAALWSGSAEINGDDVQAECSIAFCRLTAQTASAAMDATSQMGVNATEDPNASMLAQIAVRRMFSIGSSDVEFALRLLQKAWEIEPRGVFQAWIAQALTIQYVERHIKADAALVERCAHACRLALQDDPSNSIVLAAVANARINIEKNYEAGIQLARQSVQANRCNPLAWWAFSNALQCMGETRKAYVAAQNAKALAEGTRLKFWCDFQVAVTAALAGNTREAILNGESASALAPAFRPPIRYLAALYAVEGETDKLTRKVRSLQSLETDFTIERMIGDADYPIGMMRRYGQNLSDGLRLAEI